MGLFGTARFLKSVRMVVSRIEKRGLRIGRWLPVTPGGCNGLGGSSPPLSFSET